MFFQPVGETTFCHANAFINMPSLRWQNASTAFLAAFVASALNSISFFVGNPFILQTLSLNLGFGRPSPVARALHGLQLAL
jgi:hypothetical protein